MSVAIVSVPGPQEPPSALPVQSRFRDEASFRRLLSTGALSVAPITRVEEQWRLPSAPWIAERIAFAPGFSALVAALGSDREGIIAAFVAGLDRDQGRGTASLFARGLIGIAKK